MQEIIVYRNPLEAAIWKTVGSAEFFPFMVGFVVFFVVFLTVYNLLLLLKFSRYGREGQLVTNASLAAAAVCSLATIWKMWI